MTTIKEFRDVSVGTLFFIDNGVYYKGVQVNKTVWPRSNTPTHCVVHPMTLVVVLANRSN